MDGLTHSLVGLTSAKAGLERLSPFATTVCVLTANAPDIDVVTAFGGRWTFLHYHRGITHSVVGTVVLAILIPSVFCFLDRLIARLRKRRPRIHYRGLLLASLVAAATHPLMDWTNNYGLRPLLPWSGRWFYGDLVFIVDPYILLSAGGAAFLLTSDRWPRVAVWSALGFIITLVIFLVPSPWSGDEVNLSVARAIWVAGILFLGLARMLRLGHRLGRSMAVGALALVILYWGALAWAHKAAYRDAIDLANLVASRRSEHLLRVASMPTVANPFRWQCIAETEVAIYRFFVTISRDNSALSKSNLAVDRNGLPVGIERYEKPSGTGEQLVVLASRDPRAQIFLGFARFPIEHVENDNCIGQTLVQFADLRYTQPGTTRGAFAIDVPVECPAR